jgi:RNA ligase (TIGR02306 family)
MSDHTIRVIRIQAVAPWPNSDKLDLIRVGGYITATAKGTYKPGDLAVFIDPDFIVPTKHPEFDFLRIHQDGRPFPEKTEHRVTARKLRGTWSEGLLIPARKGWRDGQDVAGILGIIRWEPPVKNQSPAPVKRTLLQRLFRKKKPTCAPALTIPDYDLESTKRFNTLFDLLVATNDVCSTEKIHGSNARYVFNKGRFYMGSHHTWKRTPYVPKVRNFLRKLVGKPPIPKVGTNWWSHAAETHPWIETWCRANPGLVLWGEVFGPGIQDMTYGVPSGSIGFRVFDVFDPKQNVFWPASMLVSEFPKEQVVPIFMGVIESEGKSHIPGADHLREGMVYRGFMKDHRSANLPRGRLVLKAVSNAYLTRS